MKTVAEQDNSRVYANRPTFKMVIGICLIVLSYVIGWPGVAFFTWLSIWLKNPLWVAVGGPVIYGISHLVFMLGAYMVGERYVKYLWKWSKDLFRTRRGRQSDLSDTGATDHLNNKKE